MSAVISHLSEMAPYMLLSIPFFVCVRAVIYSKAKKLNLHREIALLIFVAFSVGLMSQTVIPKFEISNGTIILIPGISQTNFMPLRSVHITYIETIVYGNINYFIINFLGNIAVFIPIGFFVPLLWNIKSGKVVLIGASVSVFIEFCQLFLPRNTDIDDVILNTVGVVLGLLIYKLLQKYAPDFSRRFKKQNSD